MKQKYDMHILHIIPGYGGGISSFVKSLAKGNINSNAVYDVISFTSYPKDFLEIIKNQHGNCYMLPNVYKHPLKMLYEYRKILKKSNYNFIHCHISGYKGLVFKLLTPKAKKRIIMHAHHIGNDKIPFAYSPSIYISQLFSRLLSIKYLACCQQAAQYVYGKNVLAQFMPNAIDTTQYLSPLPEDEQINYLSELNLTSKTKIIGHIGRFDIVKNHKFMLRIAQSLIKKDFKFTMIFVGDGALKKEIENLAKEYGVSNHINFLGYRSDVYNLIKMFDIVLLPSLSEGLPITIIEAQAAGIPCIISDSISKEVDLGLGLVHFLPLTNLEIWTNKLIDDFSPQNTNIENRLQALKVAGYTLEEMQKIYFKVLHEINDT